MILYYETEETVTTKQRITKSICKISIYFLIIILFLVLTFVFFTPKDNKSFGIYIVAFQTIIGWLVSFTMNGVGIVVLPYEYFWSYANWPIKSLTPAEFEVEKRILLNDLLSLRERAKKLEEERPVAEKKNLVKQYIIRFWIVALDCEWNVVEREFEKLIKLSNWKKFLDPALYLAKLAFGIVFTLIMLIWVLSMILCEIIN